MHYLCKVQWLLYLPLGLTIKNPTLSPQSLFNFFFESRKKRAIIPLHRINLFVLTRRSVFTAQYMLGSFNKIQINPSALKMDI